MAKPKDYTTQIGMKYGSLTIQKINRLPKKVIAECLCDCGRETKHTLLARLMAGKITTCKTCSNKNNGQKGNISRSNSSKYNNLIGSNVNYFKVLRRSVNEEPSGTFYCQCICGNFRYLDAHELKKTSDRKSCGCQQSRLLSLSGGGTGIPYENETINCFIRKSTPEYKQWVTDCLSKHKYTCFVSGRVGGNLNVHHLLPLSKLLELYSVNKTNYLIYKEYLFNIYNGIVVTEAIHRQLHTKYGMEVSIENIIEFKSNYIK